MRLEQRVRGITGRLLVVDDSALELYMLCQQLGQEGHSVVAAAGAWEALHQLTGENFDLVVLQLNLRDLDGFKVLQTLRESPDYHRLPIIVVSFQSDVAVIARCIELGAEDFLTKPFPSALLHARVKACLEKKRLRDQEAQLLGQLQELSKQLELSNEELKRANHTLETFAFTDVLTGLPNRRFALEQLTRLWELYKRSQREFCAVLADIDHFKRFNDDYGHDCGDQVLVHVAKTLKSALRASDTVCRFGGEEFLVLCPETELEGAVLLGERLRRALAECSVPLVKTSVAVTASFGVAAASRGMERQERLLKSADEALYQAKLLGRNRVAVASGLRILVGACPRNGGAA